MDPPYRDSGEPIYIGFEQRPNGLGIAGFIVSLVGLLVTFGLLCPIGVALSCFGLFKKPRGFALAGFLIGVVGTALPLLVVWVLLRSHEVQSQRQHAKEKTEMVLEKASEEIARFRHEHSRVPEGIEGNKIVVKHSDGWDHELRYDLHPRDRKYILRSAGPDGRFETGDDLTRQSIVPSREIHDIEAVP